MNCGLIRTWTFGVLMSPPLGYVYYYYSHCIVQNSLGFGLLERRLWMPIEGPPILDQTRLSLIARNTMRKINVHEAKTQLSKLLDRAADGEEIVIAKAGKPMAKLGPLEKKN